MGYAQSRYGGLARAYDKAGGYDNGGPIMPGYNLVWNGGNTPENVLTTQQSDQVLGTRQGRFTGARNPVGGGGDVALLDRLEDMTDRIEAAVREARAINVYPRAEQSEESIAVMVNRRAEQDRRIG